MRIVGLNQHNAVFIFVVVYIIVVESFGAADDALIHVPYCYARAVQIQLKPFAKAIEVHILQQVIAVAVVTVQNIILIFV